MQISKYHTPKSTPVVNGRAYQLKLAIKSFAKISNHYRHILCDAIEKYGYVVFEKYFAFWEIIAKATLIFTLKFLKFSFKYIVKPGSKFIKALFFALIYVAKSLTLGTIDGIIDLFVTKKNTVNQNLAKITANIITMIALTLFLTHMAASASSGIANIATNPTLTKAQKSHIVKSTELKKPVVLGNGTQSKTQTRLPNGDLMPNGISYQKATTLANTWRPNAQIQVVNHLFAGNNLTEQQEFFNKIAPGAQIAAASWGVNPSVMMAQAAIESDFGRSTLASQHNNYFGIKYRGTGKKVNMPTTEYYDGVTPTKINDDFQAYDSIADSMSGNGELLRQGISGQPGRYAGAWLENTKSYQDATNNGLQGKYATAPDYATTLNKIINLYGLYVLDAHQVHNDELKK